MLKVSVPHAISWGRYGLKWKKVYLKTKIEEYAYNSGLSKLMLQTHFNCNYVLHAEVLNDFVYC